MAAAGMRQRGCGSGDAQKDRDRHGSDARQSHAARRDRPTGSSTAPREQAPRELAVRANAITSARAIRFARPWLLALALLATWEIACRTLHIPEFVLPPPSHVAQATYEF